MRTTDVCFSRCNAVVCFHAMFLGTCFTMLIAPVHCQLVTNSASHATLTDTQHWRWRNWDVFSGMQPQVAWIELSLLYQHVVPLSQKLKLSAYNYQTLLLLHATSIRFLQIHGNRRQKKKQRNVSIPGGAFYLLVETELTELWALN